MNSPYHMRKTYGALYMSEW